MSRSRRWLRDPVTWLTLALAAIAALDVWLGVDVGPSDSWDV